MRKRWISALIVAALALGLWGTIVGSNVNRPEKKIVSTKSKPGGALLAKAANSEETEETGSFTFTENLAGSKLAQEILKPELPENKVYSPLTLGMAMAMLADAATGETRQEILDAMGWASMEDLDKMVKVAYGSVNQKKDEGESSIANALWLREDMKFREEKISELAGSSYADVFSGKMGSEDYDKLHQDWLNEKTGGLLKEAVKNRKFKETLGICLSSASYYRQLWPEKMTLLENRLFLGGAYGNTRVDMLSASQKLDYYRGEHYSSVGLPLKNGTIFWLFLPDMEYNVSEILKDDTYLSVMKGDVEPVEEKADVELCFPRMDCMTDIDAKKAICELGYLRAFDNRADFSELTEYDLFVRTIPHATRICVDEYGITAAAYAEAELDEGALMLDDRIYFICNRPFFYAVADSEGMVYYEGVMKTGEEIPDDEVKIRRPIVQVNGKIYQKTDELATVTCGVADGRILYAEAADKGLTEDNISNFGEGYPYQYSDEGHLSVNIDGTWYVFEYVPDISTIYYKPKG